MQITAKKTTRDTQHQRNDRKRARQDAGTGLSLANEAIRKFPKDPKRQMGYFLYRADLNAWTGRRRTVSEKTRQEMGDSLLRAIGELRECRMPVRILTDIGQPHALALLQRWKQDGQSAATIQTKLSFLRKFLTMIGKPHALPRGGELYKLLEQKGLDSEGLTRSKVLVDSKTWEALGINPVEIIRRIAEEDQLVAIQLELEWAFGLRVMETLQIEPSVSDEGNKLVVLKGTKGGRPRAVDFDTDPATAEWQRDVLERAKKIAQRHPKRRLALPNTTLDQSRNRYYYVLRQFGITQKELGVTSHGLRHQFAARRFEALAGLPTMASGQAPMNAYSSQSQAVELAQLDVSQQLGHWRKDVTSSYLGSVGMLGRESQKRMRSWLALVEGNPLVVQALSQSGVKEAWIGGRAAMGLPLAPSEKLTLVVRMDLGPDTQGRMDELASRLNKRIARGVLLMLHIQPGVPADGLEILFREPAAGDKTMEAVHVGA